MKKTCHEYSCMTFHWGIKAGACVRVPVSSWQACKVFQSACSFVALLIPHPFLWQVSKSCTLTQINSCCHSSRELSFSHTHTITAVRVRALLLLLLPACPFETHLKFPHLLFLNGACIMCSSLTLWGRLLN